MSRLSIFAAVYSLVAVLVSGVAIFGSYRAWMQLAPFEASVQSPVESMKSQSALTAAELELVRKRGIPFAGETAAIKAAAFGSTDTNAKIVAYFELMEADLDEATRHEVATILVHCVSKEGLSVQLLNLLARFGDERHGMLLGSATRLGSSTDTELVEAWATLLAKWNAHPSTYALERMFDSYRRKSNYQPGTLSDILVRHGHANSPSVATWLAEELRDDRGFKAETSVLTKSFSEADLWAIQALGRIRHRESAPLTFDLNRRSEVSSDIRQTLVQELQKSNEPAAFYLVFFDVPELWKHAEQSVNPSPEMLEEFRRFPSARHADYMEAAFRRSGKLASYRPELESFVNEHPELTTQFDLRRRFDLRLTEADSKRLPPIAPEEFELIFERIRGGKLSIEDQRRLKGSRLDPGQHARLTEEMWHISLQNPGEQYANDLLDLFCELARSEDEAKLATVLTRRIGASESSSERALAALARLNSDFAIPNQWTFQSWDRLSPSDIPNLEEIACNVLLESSKRFQNSRLIDLLGRIGTERAKLALQTLQGIPAYSDRIAVQIQRAIDAIEKRQQDETTSTPTR